MAGPLEGIRVVDLSQVVSGPWATMLLADQGAEVIKVEPCVGGEVLRPLPNFGRGGINSLIANNNRGKLGLAIDLGFGAWGRHAASARRHGGRVRPELPAGVVERLGLGPDLLRSSNPAPGHLRDHRLRARWSVGAAARLRPDRAGHERPRRGAGQPGHPVPGPGAVDGVRQGDRVDGGPGGDRGAWWREDAPGWASTSRSPCSTRRSPSSGPTA